MKNVQVKTKIAIILGTRPEIIKMAPIIWECESRKLSYYIIHTGQHYSPNMDSLFFDELNLPRPKYNLFLSKLEFRKQIGFFTNEISHVLYKNKPDVVLVQGDTTTVVAGALAASKLGIKLAHHEAGLRSHDTRMLEEINRIITDHISDILFTPTKVATNNLVEEGVDKKNIYQTGNTIVDVVNKFKKISLNKSSIFNRLAISSNNYFLVTAHRAENVDNYIKLKSIFEGLTLVKNYFKNIDLVLPLHPRTKKMASQFGIKLPSDIKVIEPVGFFDMLALEQEARLIITDSGGIQEEACILQIPVVTIRDNTERPETVEGGFNVLVLGGKSEDILEKTKEMMRKKIIWSNPFGDGQAGQYIIDLLLDKKI